MRVRRFLTTICLAFTLLLLVAIPARAADCGLLGQLLGCDPVPETLDPVLEPLDPVLEPLDPVLGPVTGSPGVYPEGASRLFSLANQERASAGLAPLTSRADLVDLALEHTLALVESDSLFHNLDLLGRPLRTVLGASVVGENVGWSTEINDLHSRLMASPLHRASILDPRFTMVGMAVVLSENGKYYATQDFIQPDGSTPAPPEAPEPAAVVSDEPAVTPISEPVPSSTLSHPSSEPADTRADIAPPPPSEADSMPIQQGDPVQEVTAPAIGEVENLRPMLPAAADGPTASPAAVILAIALAAGVALADGAWVVRDRRPTRA